MNEEFGVGENMSIFLRRERKVFNQNLIFKFYSKIVRSITIMLL